MKYTILILIISTSCFSQKKNADPFAYGNIYDIDPQNINAFTNVFYWDFYKNVEHFNDKDFIKLTFELFNSFNTKIYFKNITSLDSTEKSKTIAIAKGMYDNCNVQIQIDYNKWMELDNVKRLWIIYHELAHDVFNLTHGKGGPLMNPTLPSYIDQFGFIDAKNDLIKYISNNNLYPSKCENNFTDLDRLIKN